MQSDGARRFWRCKLVVVAAVAVVLGLCTRGHGGVALVSNGAGAMLYEVVWIALLQASWPRLSPRTASLGVFTLTCGIELLQLCNTPPLVSLRATLPGRLLLGANGGFDPVDFVWYAAGSALGWLMLLAIRKPR